jgi:hypothetical protein
LTSQTDGEVSDNIIRDIRLLKPNKPWTAVGIKLEISFPNWKILRNDIAGTGSYCIDCNETFGVEIAENRLEESPESSDGGVLGLRNLHRNDTPSTPANAWKLGQHRLPPQRADQGLRNHHRQRRRGQAHPGEVRHHRPRQRGRGAAEEHQGSMTPDPRLTAVLRRVPVAGCLWLAGLVSRDVLLGCNHRTTTGEVTFPDGQCSVIGAQAAVDHSDVRVYVLADELDVPDPIPIASQAFYRPVRKEVRRAWYVNQDRVVSTARFSRLGAGRITLSPIKGQVVTRVGDSGCAVLGEEFGRLALVTLWTNGLLGTALGPIFHAIVETARSLGAKDLPRLNAA